MCRSDDIPGEQPQVRKPGVTEPGHRAGSRLATASARHQLLIRRNLRDPAPPQKMDSTRSDAR
jgi:hypothetical protein